MIKITGFAKIPSSEGIKVSYTYSEVNDMTGQLISQNNKGSFLVLDNDVFADVITALKTLDDYIINFLTVQKESDIDEFYR